jgi:hypothetical protein
MFQGMLTTSQKFLEAGRLCSNNKCRSGIDMTKHFDKQASQCIWCGTPF